MILFAAKISFFMAIQNFKSSYRVCEISRFRDLRECTLLSVVSINHPKPLSIAIGTFPYISEMNRTYFYALILLAGVYACNNDAPVNEENEENTEATMSSEDLMNAYADSINLSADDLKEIYRNLLNGAVNNLDSTKQIIAATSPEVTEIKANLNRLSQDVSNLVEQKKITDSDYQAMFHEIDLNTLETSEEALRALGLNLDGNTAADTTSIEN